MKIKNTRKTKKRKIQCLWVEDKERGGLKRIEIKLKLNRQLKLFS